MRLMVTDWDGDDEDNVDDDAEADEHADMVNTANNDKEFELIMKYIGIEHNITVLDIYRLGKEVNSQVRS